MNWDPVDQTVLANEQVIDGRGWRTGALVEKREIPMYYLRITAYAEELLAALDDAARLARAVKTMQANWIGKQRGRATSASRTSSTAKQAQAAGCSPRAPTRIMGATFCAVAAEHPLAHARRARTIRSSPPSSRNASAAAVMEAELATMEKKGMPTGLFVTHPLTGEKLPVWVGNYVLMGYGEGAVMGVPAHDERDFEFAQQVRPADQAGDRRRAAKRIRPTPWQAWYARARRAASIPASTTASTTQQAVDAIAADLEAKGLGEKQVQWRLRDWGISRQRYWGCPIPIIHCADVRRRAGARRPAAGRAAGGPACPTAPAIRSTSAPTFVETHVPEVRRPAKRETDTMDTFVDSSWYFARYRLPGPATTRWSTSAPTTGCRSTSTSAASSTRSCTCSIRASGPR